ncbi:MAG: hypothetical protein IJQ81_12070 [Oscillibacter sp.]|nr:hypothetical protein [Oscillibacter sp.]
MKKCKILSFFDPDANTLKEDKHSDYEVNDFPEVEAFLEKYLDDGFVVKNMTETDDGYSFYLERDI